MAGVIEALLEATEFVVGDAVDLVAFVST